MWDYCNHIANTEWSTATRDLHSHAATLDCQYLHSFTSLSLSLSHKYTSVCLYSLIWARNCHQKLFLLKRWHVVAFSMRFDVTAWSGKDPNEVLAGNVSWALDIFILSLRSYRHKWAYVFRRKAPFFWSHPPRHSLEEWWHFCLKQQKKKITQM